MNKILIIALLFYSIPCFADGASATGTVSVNVVTNTATLSQDPETGVVTESSGNVVPDKMTICDSNSCWYIYAF
jgi:hypothetical protein